LQYSKIKTQLVMKKIIATLDLAITAMTAQAQSVELKTNAFGMIFGAYNATAEFQLDNNPSLTVLGSAWYNTPEFKDWTWTERDGGLSAGVRQYFNRYEDQGMFLGLASRYIFGTDGSSGYYDADWNWISTGSISDDYLSLGFTIGYKYIYNDKITVDAFIGGGRILWEEEDWRGPAEFISGFNFGYRF
jgi:hypothetical protein